MKNILLPYVCVLALFLASCKKTPKDIVPEPEPSADETVLLNHAVTEQNRRFAKLMNTVTISTFLHGYILNEEGEPLADVQITSGTASTSTNEDGYFVFTDIELKENYALVKTVKAGYFDNFKTFTPLPNTINRIDIVLQETGTPKYLNASTGGIVTLDSEKVKLDIPKNTLIDQNGNLYSGSVRVQARYIDPSADRFSDMMPGMLAGLTDEESVVGMISYGMIHVALSDDDGHPLQISGGKTVAVTLPARAGDPDKIPTWHFNEDYGLWVESGKGVKQGNQYTFEANHFSIWNLDVKIPDVVPRTDISFIPAIAVPVEIFSSDFTNILGKVHSDADGKVALANLPPRIGIRVRTECKVIEKVVDVNSVATTVELDISGTALSVKTDLLFKDCENATMDNMYFILKSVNNRNIESSSSTGSDGVVSTNIILCDNMIGTADEIITTVYVNNNTVKRDTTAWIWTNGTQDITVNFCEAEEENPYLNPNLTYRSLTDIDGNRYPTIQIGTQTWMAEDLKTTRLNDGTVIQDLTGKDIWSTNANGAKAPAYWDRGAPYGLLYNYSVVATEKICPQGWRVPTKTDWDMLSNHLGSNAGAKMKSTGHLGLGLQYLWRTPNSGATNESGFTALPAGEIDTYGNDGTVGRPSEAARFWSSTTDPNISSWTSRASIHYNTTSMSIAGTDKSYGLSCRCVKDD